MAMVIQEYAGSGFSTEIVEEENLLQDISLKESDETSSPVDPNSLMVDVEGIHAYPHATRNFTRYMPKCLKASVASWTTPYLRPLIKHHNEKDGHIIGRIINAEYKARDTFSGTPALLFTVNVPGEDAKADILNGTESTVSIGVIAHDVRCSICGQQLATGERCEHERGVSYDGETCYWDIHSMEAKELSYVIVPSDIYAKNRKMYSLAKSGEQTQISECLDDKTEKGETRMSEDTTKALAEAKAKVSTLEAKVTELSEACKKSETTVAELTEAKGKLEKETSSLKETNDALQKELTALKEKASNLEAQRKEDAALREGLETALEEAKVARKGSLIETVQALRKAIGKKEMDAEAIKNRSEESLADTILDLKEELSEADKKNDHAEIAQAANSVSSPALAEEAENDPAKNQPLKETAEKRVDLAAGFQDLLADIISYHK